MERIPNRKIILLLSLLLTLAGCQPYSSSYRTTGSPPAGILGAMLGGGAAAFAGASKPIVALAALGGGSLGYYMTTMRFSSAEILHAGGQVYMLGDYLTIEIPSDYLFDTNSDEFLPGTEPVLDSIYSVLTRYPHNNILISGNTSGTDSEHAELRLSEARARQIASYMWMKGLGLADVPAKEPNQKLNYVGYGNYFPIASDKYLKGIRSNSRIQITSYPQNSKFTINGCYKVYKNIGSDELVHCTNDVDDFGKSKSSTADDTASDTNNVAQPANVDNQVASNKLTTDSPEYAELNSEFQTPIENHNPVVASSSPSAITPASGDVLFKKESMKG